MVKVFVENISHDLKVSILVMLKADIAVVYDLMISNSRPLLIWQSLKLFECCSAVIRYLYNVQPHSIVINKDIQPGKTDFLKEYILTQHQLY